MFEAGSLLLLDARSDREGLDGLSQTFLHQRRFLVHFLARTGSELAG